MALIIAETPSLPELESSATQSSASTSSDLPVTIKRSASAEQLVEPSSNKKKKARHASAGATRKSRKTRPRIGRQNSGASDGQTVNGQYSVGTWSHKSSHNLSPSLLEEVLNEKKMALCQSPEVINHLQMIQNEVRKNKLCVASCSYDGDQETVSKERLKTMLTKKC